MPLHTTPHATPVLVVGTTAAPPSRAPSAEPYSPLASQSVEEMANGMTSTWYLDYRWLLVFVSVTVGGVLAGLAVRAVEAWGARYGGWLLSPIIRRSLRWMPR